MSAISLGSKWREALVYMVAIVVAVAAVMLVAALGYRTGVVVLVGLAALAVGVPLAVAAFFRRPELAVYLVFVLVAFFNEYSQTEWGVRSADQLATLYNWRIVPGLTASVFDLFFAGLVGLWLVRKWLRREPFAWPPRILWLPGILSLAFVGYAAVLGLFRLGEGFEMYHILRELRPFAYGLLMLVMTVDILTMRGKAETMWRLIVAVAIVRGIQGIVRHSLGIGRTYYGTTMVYYDYSDTILLLMGLSFILTWLLGRKQWNWKTLLAAGLMALPIAYSFVFSFRRSFWIGTAASLALFTFYANKRERSRYLGFIAAAGLALVILVAATGQVDLVTQRILSVTETETDSSNFFRVLDTENALNALYHSAGMGMGFGSRYEVVATIYWLSDFISHVSRASHNGYLYIAMKMGLLGLVAWTWFWLANLKISWDLSKWPRFRALGLGAIVTLIASAVANLFLPLYYNLRPLLLLAILCGLASAAWNLTRTRKASETP